MKNILKKVRALSIVLFSIVLAVSVLGCPSDSGTPTSGTTFQSQIDAATPGSTVTLNTSYSGSSITINKALTVNGNGISNLSIYVNSSVANNVTLRNFSNANVTVANSSRRALDNRMARAANDADEPDHFKKMGEDALQLKLEGCDITKFDAEADVALFLESGDGKKSEIEELNLKAGVEEFTFIEMDKADKPETTEDEATPTADKSSVGELKIEGEDIGKINLIGGKFDEVSIPDDFAGSNIDFKYDKEFDDQFGEFDGKDAFFGNQKIAEKDAGVVEKTGTGSENVYSFSMTQENFNNLCLPDQDGNGRFAIVFMTDAQKNAITAASNPSNPYHDLNPWPGVATFANPIYAAIPAGFFAIDEYGSDGVKTIYGTEYAYVDYAAAYARGDALYKLQDVVVLEKYRNYNKEAFVAEVNNGSVEIFVDMSKIKKEDVLLCAFWEPAEDETNPVPKGAEAGTKMTEMNLDGYKPYLVIDTINQGEAIDNAFDSFALHQGSNQQAMSNMIPYGNAIKLQHEYSVIYIPMTAGATYPSLAGVNYTVKDTPYTPGTLHPLQDQDFD